MSAEQNVSTLDALVKSLQALPDNATAEDAMALFRRPKDEAFEQARRLASLVRVLDRDVYGFLIAGSTVPPSLEDLLKAFPRDFQPVSPESWEMRASDRDFLLSEWQKQEPVWRAWNTRLFDEYFKSKTDKPSELEAVYHAAASTTPASAIPFFEERYRTADRRADFSHCHALLEAVRSQEKFRYREFSIAYRDKARYLQSRLLFLDALQKSGSYLERSEPHERLKAVLDRPGPRPWIFHMHATGGLGKSMFVRWSVSRDLVLRRVPCAYVDFDDYDLVTFVQHPFRLLEMIIGQWAQQMTQTALSSAVEILQRAKDLEGWDENIIGDLRVKLQGAAIQTEMVAVLDTLEELTLSQPEWLKKCVATLRKLGEFMPHFTLILTGRYNLVERIAGLFDASEIVPYELLPFSRDEAEGYLTLRGVTDTAMQNAIIDRAAIDEEAAEPVAGTVTGALGGAVGEPQPGPRLNPFKLSLLVELVLDQDGLTPEGVRKLPNVDIAYLIERVILRITSQPLRWMIRYGAIARRLTRPFLEQVLLPPLKEALRGRSTDLSQSHLSAKVQKYLDSKVAWKTDAALAERLKPTDLWTDLAAYARERGWISMIPGEEALQLHPEVVKPVQVLLSEQPIYVTLHEAARDFYLAVWANRASIPAKESATAATEAIYHAAALHRGDDAPELWRQLLKQANAESAYAIATEPTRAAYLGEEDRPQDAAWCCEAHVASARVKLHEGGVGVTAASDSAAAFRVHVAAARKQAPDPSRVPALFVALADVAESDASDDKKAEAIEQQLAEFEEPYDLFWLHLHAARYWTTARREDRAEFNWIAAASLADRAGIVPTGQAQIALIVAGVYGRLGRYREAMAAYDRVRETKVMARETLEQQARLALEKHDLRRALPLMGELARVGGADSAAYQLLDLRQGVELGDSLSFFQRVRTVVNAFEGKSEAERQEVLTATYLLQGEASRYVMNFSAALEAFSRAADLVARDPSNTRARVRELELYAFDMGDDSTARQNLGRWVTTARGSDDNARSLTVAALLLARGGNRAGTIPMVNDLASYPLPSARCRGLLIGLGWDLFADPAVRVGLLIESLQALDPPEMCVEVFSILEHLPVPSPSLAPAYAGIVDVVRPLLGKPYETPVELPLQMLDLARACGLTGAEARESLQLADDMRPSPQLPTSRLWYGLRLLDHHARFGTPAPCRYQDLLAESVAAGARGTPLEAMLKSRASIELARAGDIKGARALADEAVAVWEKQPDNRLGAEVKQARLDLLRAAVFGAQGELESLPPRAPDAAASEKPAARRSAEREAAPPPPAVEPMERAVAAGPPKPAAPAPPARELTQIVLTDSAAKKLDAQFESLSINAVSMALFNDWRSVQQALVSALNESNAGHVHVQPSIRIRTPVPHASLPWEFVAPALGSRLLCRATNIASAAGTAGAGQPRLAPRADKRSVMVINARGSDFEQGQMAFGVSDAAASGFSMEQLYKEEQAADEVLAFVAPHPDELQKALAELRPAVLHIVGQFFSTTTGTYIDFEGVDARIFASGAATKGGQGLGSSLDSRRLIRYLDKQFPVVILDVTAPENVTDILQMLLLRNRFAAELLQSGSVRAVLATGLTGADERETFARTLIRGVRDNTSLDFLWNSLRSDHEPVDLFQLLRQFSSALFVEDPYARIFEDDRGSRDDKDEKEPSSWRR